MLKDLEPVVEDLVIIQILARASAEPGLNLDEDIVDTSTCFSGSHFSVPCGPRLRTGGTGRSHQAG